MISLNVVNADVNVNVYHCISVVTFIDACLSDTDSIYPKLAM
jgi:hypothetical protein